MASLGSGSLADAIKEFEKKFKDKSGLKWDDRAADPKNGKCEYIRHLLRVTVAPFPCPARIVLSDSLANTHRCVRGEKLQP